MPKSVAILLAVWEPREDWLCELLNSLNAQTYPNLRLYVRDDCSPTYPTARLQAVLEQHITRFPFTLARNEVNCGSNQTFARLLEECEGDYVAFCDQDDVWLPEKIENTVRLLESSPLSPVAVCANVSVIDGDGNPIAARIDEHRKRHVFLRGNDLAGGLIYRNFAMGCTMMLTRKRAQSYLPFPDELVHDHYLAYRAALEGALDYLDEPQMRYRVYGGNQTGVMTGVKTKEDYFGRRIALFDKRVRCLSHYAALPELDRAQAWCDARIKNYRHERGGFRMLWRMRKVNRATSLFELFALRAPTPLFRLAVSMVKRGML